MHDPVTNPAHYADGNGIECIDAIEASMSPQEFKGFLKGNSQKYLWRYTRKNGAEDLKKAEWYLERLIALREKDEAMGNAIEEITKEVLSVNCDPDDYLKPSGCPSFFCPLPNMRRGPYEAMFAPIPN